MQKPKNILPLNRKASASSSVLSLFLLHEWLKPIINVDKMYNV